MAKRPGLWANIRAKRKRIAAGSKERMRSIGAKGAPSASDFKAASKSSSNKPSSRKNKSTKKRTKK